MAEIKKQYGGTPFRKAIDHFRSKLNMPTRHWDDLWQDQHARGFMIAGAMKADLISDLRGAVDKAISNGATLADFRKDFDSIVEKHGWIYKGGRNWLTKVIYDTNLRTSYQAGRYSQMTDPDVTALRPYWQYRHGDSALPRPEHLAWDGLILPHDDPWWDTHYPPNGWGCRCSVVSLSRRDLEKMGKKAPDKAPAVRYRQWEDRSGVRHRVPAGIDPGFDYNAGKARGRSYKVLADKFETLDYEVAKPFMKEFLAGPVFIRFFDGKIRGEFPVAVLSDADKTALGTKAQTVWLSQTTLKEHKKKHPEMLLKDYRHIPEIIEHGEVYKQNEERLIYLKKQGRLYRAALKRTKDRQENFYLTLFTTGEETADFQVRKKYERVR